MSEPFWPLVVHYRHAPPGADERLQLLEAEAERRFGNRTDAGHWYLNRQPSLDPSETPHRIAQASPEGLQRVLDYLAGLDIKPRPDPYPTINRGRKKRR